VFVPQVGLSDGLVHDLYEKYRKNEKIQTLWLASP
jgi:hypothetical protein